MTIIVKLLIIDNIHQRGRIKLKLMTSNLATLRILPELKTCDAMLNKYLALENTKCLTQITSTG